MEKLKKNIINPKAFSPTACDICDDTGWKMVKSGVKRCRCLLNRIKERRRKKVPKKFKDARIENFRPLSCKMYNPLEGEMSEQVNIKDVFMPDFNYFMYGKLGIGKSYVLWSQYNYLISKNYIFPIYADLESEFLDKYQEYKLSDLNGGRKEFFHLDEPGVKLFIDDLATTKYTESRSMNLFEVVDMLCRNESGLTITSNKTLGEIEKGELLGMNTNRITRRIKDMCTVVYF